MMRTYRALFCSVLVVFVLITGCKKSKNIQFCEGVDIKNNPINCGTTFTTGELSLVVKQDNNFNVNELKIVVYKKNQYSLKKLYEFNHKVSPDSTMAIIPISFYTEGEYKIEIYKNQNKIGTNLIKIIEQIN